METEIQRTILSKALKYQEPVVESIIAGGWQASF
jgi:hypothetical protein